MRFHPSPAAKKSGGKSQRISYKSFWHLRHNSMFAGFTIKGIKLAEFSIFLCRTISKNIKGFESIKMRNKTTNFPWKPGNLTGVGGSLGRESQQVKTLRTIKNKTFCMSSCYPYFKL